MATATQTPEVTIYANAADPLTPVVVQYMNEHSGCSVTTTYIDQDASDGSDDTEEGGKCLGYPRIHVGNKYFGGVGCLDKFPLRVTEHRLKEITGEVDEPMCREQKEFDRLILFNGKHEHEWADMWTLYKKELANFWVVNEIDLQDDLVHWKNLNQGERHFITHILAFFASLDFLVCENLASNFGQEILNAQVRSHFAAQELIETIHAEAYGLLIMTYIQDAEQRESILRSIQTMPIIESKAKWAVKYMNADKVSLAERLCGFICLEGVQFSSSFASVYYFKSRGLLPGLCFANALIARDESAHAEGGVMLYSKLENQLPESRVHEIFRDAVDVEREFICESLPVDLIGINSREMSRYVEYIADFWLVKLGYGKLYNSNNPFDWMESISLQGVSNFFEVRSSEYSKANVLVAEDEQEFSLDTEF